jgi:hypothetical protein
MTPSEIEDFWCTASPPVEAVYFHDQSGFASFFVLMRDGSITAQVDNRWPASLQDLTNAIVYFSA